MLLRNLSANSRRLPPLPAELKRRELSTVVLYGGVFLALLLTAEPAGISPEIVQSPDDEPAHTPALDEPDGA